MINRLFIKLLMIIIFLFLFPANVFAVVDPLFVPNNKFGIHIMNEGDLDNAAKLVNSAGGDWGYITVVIPENERKVEKWQNIFNRMKELHLIPLVRLATALEGDYWKEPQMEDVFPWTDFLSGLKWVTKNRYVIIFNEPNHSEEWGMKLDPKSYAGILATFSATLKKSSSDFFILPAGFDASAPNSWNTMDEGNFLKSMVAADHEIFDKIDGWTSHSYPNPGFAGESKDNGRGSIGTYRWEIKLLEKLGNTRNLPVFITETGWPHQDGSIFNKWFKKTDDVPKLLEDAIYNVWTDPQITAITPFILNYQAYPFSNFSWQKISSGDFYPQYETYKNIPKTKGEPMLEEVIKDEKVLAAQTNKPILTKNTNSLNKGNSNWINFLRLKLQMLTQFISTLF